MNSEPPKLTQDQKINYLFNKKWEEEQEIIEYNKRQAAMPWYLDTCFAFPASILLLILLIWGITSLFRLVAGIS